MDLIVTTGIFYLRRLYSKGVRSPQLLLLAIFIHSTLKDISVVMVNPWVMTGSSSAVRPFQQSSSTQRQPDRSTWRYISTEEFPASWPAIKYQQNQPQNPTKQERHWWLPTKVLHQENRIQELKELFSAFLQSQHTRR